MKSFKICNYGLFEVYMKNTAKLTSRHLKCSFWIAHFGQMANWIIKCALWWAFLISCEVKGFQIANPSLKALIACSQFFLIGSKDYIQLILQIPAFAVSILTSLWLFWGIFGHFHPITSLLHPRGTLLLSLIFIVSAGCYSDRHMLPT